MMKHSKLLIRAATAALLAVTAGTLCSCNDDNKTETDPIAPAIEHRNAGFHESRGEFLPYFPHEMHGNRRVFLELPDFLKPKDKSDKEEKPAESEEEGKENCPGASDEGKHHCRPHPRHGKKKPAPDTEDGSTNDNADPSDDNAERQTSAS